MTRQAFRSGSKYLDEAMAEVIAGETEMFVSESDARKGIVKPFAVFCGDLPVPYDDYVSKARKDKMPDSADEFLLLLWDRDITGRRLGAKFPNNLILNNSVTVLVRDCQVCRIGEDIESAGYFRVGEWFFDREEFAKESDRISLDIVAIDSNGVSHPINRMPTIDYAIKHDISYDNFQFKIDVTVGGFLAAIIFAGYNKDDVLRCVDEMSESGGETVSYKTDPLRLMLKI
jgi:hypothetical protein